MNKYEQEAAQLIMKFSPFTKSYRDNVCNDDAKKCALIAVDLVIRDRKTDLDDPDITSDQIEGVNLLINRYQKVKEAIKKIKT